MPKPKDYTGQKFGKLTAIRFAGYQISGKSRKRLWLYLCDCGREKIAMSEKVNRGWTKSCGCLRSSRTPLESLQWQVFSEYYRDGDLTFQEFLTMTQEPCHWCGAWRPNTRIHRNKRDVSWAYHGLDRLNNSQTHNFDNVVTSCWKCNEARSNSTVSNWLKHICQIYQHQANQNFNYI